MIWVILLQEAIYADFFGVQILVHRVRPLDCCFRCHDSRFPLSGFGFKNFFLTASRQNGVPSLKRGLKLIRELKCIGIFEIQNDENWCRRGSGKSGEIGEIGARSWPCLLAMGQGGSTGPVSKKTLSGPKTNSLKSPVFPRVANPQKTRDHWRGVIGYFIETSG